MRRRLTKSGSTTSASPMTTSSKASDKGRDGLPLGRTWADGTAATTTTFWSDRLRPGTASPPPATRPAGRRSTPWSPNGPSVSRRTDTSSTREAQRPTLHLRQDGRRTGDGYLYCGNKTALRHLSRITDWAVKNLDRSKPLPDGCEWYTLSENSIGPIWPPAMRSTAILPRSGSIRNTGISTPATKTLRTERQRQHRRPIMRTAT